MNNTNLKHNNLYFFDKNGEYYNFHYEGFVLLTQKPVDWEYNKTTYFKLNEENEYVQCDESDEWTDSYGDQIQEYYTKSDKWVGDIFLDDTSTGIFSVGSLIILEKDNLGNYRQPYKKNDDIYCWVAGFQEELKDIFLFTYDPNYINYTHTALSQEPIGPNIIKSDYLQIGLSDNNEIVNEAAYINFAICSDEENTFKRTLYIYEANENYEPVKDDIKENIVALITIYGKTINEDERLKSICENFGYNIIDTDSIAFEKTNVKEILPDWTIINEKRKEIILEGHNIYPYIGAYKGIINAIKYFGYNELQLREFWKNVDPNSPYYGKFVQTDCIDFLSVDNVRFNQPKVTLPSKQYRKTSLFSLIYKINDITPNKFDEDNLPLTHENQTYTQEEILIKLFALKRKLEKDFLPLNAKIKDIVGEADFFALNELTNSISVNIKNNVQVGINPTFDIINGERYNEFDETVHANLVDLRTFLIEYYNSTESNIDKPSETFYDENDAVNMLSWWNLFTSPREKYSLIIDEKLVCLKSIMDNGTSDDNFSVNKIKDVYLAYFKDYNPNIKYTGYYEDGKQSEYLGEIDPLPDNWHFITSFKTDDRKKYIPYEENYGSESGSESGSGSGSGSGFIYNNSADTIPVGALVILKNTTFDKFIFDNKRNDSSVDSLDITYDELAQGNKYDIITIGLENFAEYGVDYAGNIINAEEDDHLILLFDNDIEVVNYSTVATDTVNSIMKTVYINCISYKNEHSELLKNVKFNFNESTNEVEIQGIDAYKFKWNIVHPLLPSEYEDSIESDMRYSVAVSNRKKSNSLFSWDNINRFDTIGIEWTIKKDADDFSPSYYFNSFEKFNSRDIEMYNELPIMLPYIGLYTIEMKLFNLYNHVSNIVKRNCLEVVGREVEFSGWYTSQEESSSLYESNKDTDVEVIYDSGSGSGNSGSGNGTFNNTDNEENIAENEESLELFYYWSNNNIHNINNEYTWEKCGDYIMSEYGSTWDNAVKPSTTWSEATSALYEGLDNANVIENNLSYVNDKNTHTANYQTYIKEYSSETNLPIFKHSNTGPYVWNNCKCPWNEAFHKSWDSMEESGDIPFYIDVNKTEMSILNDIVDNELRYEISNPKLVFTLQREQLYRFNHVAGTPTEFVFPENGSLTDCNLIDMYNGLTQWLKDSYNENIERYINVNFCYSKEEYLDECEYIISDKIRYLESISEEDEQYEYQTKQYVVKQTDDPYVFSIEETSGSGSGSDSGSETGDDEYVTINYLQEITNVDFTKIEENQYIGILENSDVIVKKGEQIPVVNYCKLERIEKSELTYTDTLIQHNSRLDNIELDEEVRYINDVDIEDVPKNFIYTDEDGIEHVDTNNYKVGLMPWKYYKHLIEKGINNQTEPKRWYYTYIDSSNADYDSSDGISTKYVDRLIPTTSPILNENDYIETSNYNDIINPDNYTASYVYLQYIEKNIYEYFNVIPCYKYKVIPYIKYHIKPDNDDPQRVLIIGKYNSMLFDLFDVNVVYEVNNHNNINKISLGCEHPGIIQHNTEIHNPTWNDVNFINSWKKLPKLTRICFTYDKCKILGKRNPTWTFKNLQTEKEIVIKSKYAAYLFKESGNYSVSLELYDSNKNKYIATKNYFTIV